jgi:hypothetical protein
VLDQLRSLERRINRILAKAEAAEDLTTALKAVYEARETLVSISRLSGADRSAQPEPLKIEIIYRDVPLPAPARDGVIETSAERLR